jgi:hypothetical protein
MTGGVFCRPRNCHGQCHSWNHGVSDPGARASNGPAPVLRGRSRHGRRRSLSLSVRPSFLSAPALTVLRNVTLIVTHFIRTIWFCSRRRFGSVRGTRSAPDCAADCCVCAERDRCPLRRSLHDNEHDCDGCADHHTFDARSVLVTVQGSSLRAARACARPAGLDGACAQIRSWAIT